MGKIGGCERSEARERTDSGDGVTPSIPSLGKHVPFPLPFSPANSTS
jgi:hypothetical protein